MKRSAWRLIVMVIALSAVLSVTVLALSSAVLGDINQDEKLNSADIRVMLRYLVGGGSLTAQERLLADCDGNNRIDTLDVRYVLNTLTLGQTPSTLATTTTTTMTTTTTKPSLDDDGYYDDIVKP